MGLIGNYSFLHKSPGNFIGGSPLSPVSSLRSNYDKAGSIRSSEYHFGKFYAIPQGYSTPYAYLMPRVYNFISSYTSSNGMIEDNALLAGGRNLEAPMSANIVLVNAQLDQIVTFIASSLISIFKTNAQIDASVNLLATSNLALSSNANIGAIIDALASSSTSINANVFLSALANLNAEAGGAEPLSPRGLAEAIWGTLSNEYTGELGTFGYQIEALKLKLSELYQINGLDQDNPMTVTESSRVAGSITQNFTGDGISTTTVTRV
jgi:hypothetical protein